MFDSESTSYYDILDIKPDASPNEIRQAYLRAKAAYGKNSPALYSLFDAADTRKVIEQLEQAYLVLSNPEKRKEYDKIHGFLKPSHLVQQHSLNPALTSPLSNTRSSHASSDLAEHAAQAVLGTSFRTSVDDLFSVEPSEPRIPDISRIAPKAPVLHGGSFEERIGSIQRAHLVRDLQADPVFEESIIRETAFRGEFLRKVREYRKVSIDELSEFTKISRSYINAIESEEFKALPAAVYVRGFVTQIAKALKLESEKVALGYMSYYKSTYKK